MSKNARSDAGEASGRSSWTTRAAVVAAVTTLIASIGGLYYNGKSTRLATAQAQQAQRAQASERFSRSVEELGSQSVTVRTGAVYAFGGLFRDPNGDAPAIVDILNSFVRQQAGDRAGTREAPAPTPSDITAALQVLRHHEILLKGVDLSGYDLTGVDLTGADLNGADLTHADLTSADLTRALLIDALLDGAHLNGAYLERAHLNVASLVGAELSDAHLTNASLSGADLTGADLTGADLTGADLTGADLTGADLERADLTAATLTGAVLRDVRNSTDATFTRAFCGFPANQACSSATAAPPS